MDYSLLVMKINWAGYAIDNDQEEEYIIRDKFIHSFQAMSCINEPGIYYHIAIIDYL